MRLRILAAIAIFLIVAAPSAHAQSQTVLEWTQRIHSAAGLGAWNGHTLSFTADRPHDYNVTNTTTSLLISATISIDSGTGGPQSREFQISLNGTLLGFCKIHVTNDGSGTVGLQGRGSIYGGNRCPTTDLMGTELFDIDNTNNFTFGNTGSAAVEFVNINVYLLVEDTIMIPSDININTSFDAVATFMPLLLWVAYTVLTQRGDWTWRVTFGALGFLIVLVPMPTIMTWGIALMQAGIIIYVIAQRNTK